MPWSTVYRIRAEQNKGVIQDSGLCLPRKAFLLLSEPSFLAGELGTYSGYILGCQAQDMFWGVRLFLRGPRVRLFYLYQYVLSYADLFSHQLDIHGSPSRCPGCFSVQRILHSNVIALQALYSSCSRSILYLIQHSYSDASLNKIFYIILVFFIRNFHHLFGSI